MRSARLRDTPLRPTGAAIDRGRVASGAAVDAVAGASPGADAVLARAGDQPVGTLSAAQAVVALAGVQAVLAGGAGEPVVARAARQAVVARAAMDAVVAGGAGEAVGRGAAAEAVLATHTDEGVLAGARAASGDVVAVAGVDHVVATATVDPVIAAEAADHVVALGALDAIVAGRSEDGAPGGRHHRAAGALACFGVGVDRAQQPAQGGVRERRSCDGHPGGAGRAVADRAQPGTGNAVVHRQHDIVITGVQAAQEPNPGPLVVIVVLIERA